MSQQLHREYLKVMGIDVWESREPVASEMPRQVAMEGPSLEPESIQASEPTLLAEEVLPPVQDKVVPASSDELAALDWKGLQRCVQDCTRCELHQTRIQTVFGVGNPNADLLIIGEAPGADEDEQGEPFVGRAGQLLNAMLQAIQLSRSDIYIANILKCRPPNNRDPKPEEAALCSAFLKRQIELIQPKLILALGRIAAQRMLQVDTSLANLRGTVHEYSVTQTPMIVTYHPAYLLRSPAEKSKAWQDLLFVKQTMDSYH